MIATKETVPASVYEKWDAPARAQCHTAAELELDAVSREMELDSRIDLTLDDYPPAPSDVVPKVESRSPSLDILRNAQASESGEKAHTFVEGSSTSSGKRKASDTNLEARRRLRPRCAVFPPSSPLRKPWHDALESS